MMPPPPPGAIFSAPPSVISRPPQANPLTEQDKGAIISKEPKTTITAKPQIRNTQAELTKLVPTALRVKREQRQKVKKPGAEGFESAPQQPAHTAQKATTGATKDDAYAQFMKEMAGLL